MPRERKRSASFAHWADRIEAAHGRQIILLDLDSPEPSPDRNKSRNLIATLACRDCGYRWRTRAQMAAGGRGCTRCKASAGERGIAQLLVEKRIPHRYNKRLQGDLGAFTPSFPGGIYPDFQLLDRPVIIEFDGAGHYQNLHFGRPEGEAVFEQSATYTQCRDLARDIVFRRLGFTVWRVPHFWGWPLARATLVAGLKGDPVAIAALTNFHYSELLPFTMETT